MKRLQVLINGQWEYVFCRNEREKLPIITKDRTNAIPGNNNSLQYFTMHYPVEFRITK